MIVLQAGATDVDGAAAVEVDEVAGFDVLASSIGVLL